MKKFFYFLVVLVVFMVACTSEEIIPTERVRSHGISRANITSRVTLDNVMTLAEVMGRSKNVTRAANDEDIICITDEEGDTVFFVVNHPEGGWTMYASDKRVPAIVAECNSGKFVLEHAIDAFGAWLEDMKEDMKKVCQAGDNELNFTPEEIDYNKEFWMSICEPDVCARTYRTRETKGGGIIDPLRSGHYELDTTYSYLTLYDSLEHLTNTLWHQNYPYNKFCPLISNNDTVRAPAGCVAIAGAQMLYYLHYKLGYPVYIPDSAYCIGNINNYIWNQYTQNNPNVWIQMNDNHGNDDNGIFAAPLVANVGFLVDMDYGSESSKADTEDLVGAFNNYGISCQYTDYDKDLLYTSLLDSMPVIVRAKYSVLHGHAFIVDGYKRKAMRTTYVYKWVSDFPTLPHQPGGPFIPITPGGELYADSIVHTYGAIYFSYIKMNWGWKVPTNQTELNANEIWFAPTGDWILKFKDETYAFNKRRKMIYNFNLIN